ncbi:serine/threonine protein phosphatase Azr1 [Achlya hypogyna]|uniref:Protein phosphatase n=1 Tax=Achlya hypogyna TaxID=1202772 RepID=A0A0A7CN06_ACHHY|nr:secreted protein [Achlya hypogyna]OQS01555.1 serine/threonine protein phosphatase Azr1 [Achlya hypogyna]
MIAKLLKSAPWLAVLAALVASQDATLETCAVDASGISSCAGKAALSLEIGVGCKPKRSRHVAKVAYSDTAKNCGEDAFYVSSASDAMYMSFGVADGVGGWTESGVDPSAFSLALVEGSKSSFEATPRPHPLSLMQDGFAHVKEGGDANPGGSTAVFLVLDRTTGRLDTANLGDSGYLIIRNGRVIFRSVEQTWAFNAPYQLALYPSWMQAPDVDPYPPEKAFLTHHTVEAGDVIVVGSDGLFDNVFDNEILDEANRFLRPLFKSSSDAPSPAALHQAMIDLSYSLTLMANAFAHDESRDSPFSKLAREGYGYQFSGGKVDDTTVMAIYVHRSA